MTKLELPESFDQWPRDDQIEYLTHTGNKEGLIQYAIDTIGADIDIGHRTGGLKKGEWAEIVVALEESDA